MIRCTLSQPKGYVCSRQQGHGGPCTLTPKSHWWDGLSEALGEALFGGGR